MMVDERDADVIVVLAQPLHSVKLGRHIDELVLRDLSLSQLRFLRGVEANEDGLANVARDNVLPFE